MPKIREIEIYNWPRTLLVLAVFFWSGNFIVGRAVYPSVPPIALAFWRWTVAFLVLLPFVLPRLRQDWPAIRGSWPVLLLLSALGVASFNTLLYAGLQWTIAINAFLIQSTMPVVIVGLSALVFRERITIVQSIGIPVALSGAAIIGAEGNIGVFRFVSVDAGDALIVIAVFCYAAYSVLLRLRPAIHPLSFVATTFLMASLTLLPFYIWETSSVRSADLSVSAVSAIIYVAVFPSIVSFICFNRGVELIGANQAGLFIYLMPVFGSVMAIAFLGESLHWFHGAGICCIALGIWLSTRDRTSLAAEASAPFNSSGETVQSATERARSLSSRSTDTTSS